MELDEKQLKAAVREAVREIMAELRPMPVPAPPAPVTEIVIRCGSPEAVQVLGGGISLLSYCCPGPGLSLDEKSKERLQRIKDKTGEEPEDVISKLELQIRGRQLTEEIEKSAKEVGVE